MGLPKFIKILKRSGSQFFETHISWVLVGPKQTLKIKKPVKFSFLDFSSLAKRKHFCHEEIRLNKRFSPSIYQKVMPIKEKDKIIDYAVVMKTLPQEKRLDKLLQKNKVTRPMIKKLAKGIWVFHKKAKIIKKIKHPEVIRRNHEADYQMLLGARPDHKLLAQIHSYLIQFINHNAKLFKSRVKQGKVRDLHGDLHSENIFYLKKPYLFDCIEFNANFRCIDILAEISFLLMDLEFRKKPKLAQELLKTYLSLSHEAGLDHLLNFYKCHYAFVEGWVNTTSGKPKLARKYFNLAGQYAQTKPKLIAIGGIIGTGKSTLAKALAAKLKLSLLRSDLVRQESGPGQNPYSSSAIKKTYHSLLTKAAHLLEKGQGVMIDASFSKKLYRKWLQELATKYQAKLNFIETTSPDKIILKRLKARRKDTSDARAWLLKPFKKAYEAPNEIPRLKIATLGRRKMTLKKVLASLS